MKYPKGRDRCLVSFDRLRTQVSDCLILTSWERLMTLLLFTLLLNCCLYRLKQGLDYGAPIPVCQSDSPAF